MTTLTLLPANKSFDVASGTSLLKAIVDAGIQLAIKCGGNAGCGGCHVFIQEGRKTVSRMTPAENAKLDTLVGVSSKSRLACQVVLGAEPVTVEIPGALSGF